MSYRIRNAPPRLPSSGCPGFTLIELLVVLALLAIVAAFALPSFQGLIYHHRVEVAVEEITHAIRLARAEAIRTRDVVAIINTGNAADNPNPPCRHSGGTGYGSNWSCGIDIYRDADSLDAQQKSFNGAENEATFKTIFFDGVAVNVWYAGASELSDPDPDKQKVASYQIAFEPYGFLCTGIGTNMTGGTQRTNICLPSQTGKLINVWPITPQDPMIPDLGAAFGPSDMAKKYAKVICVNGGGEIDIRNWNDANKCNPAP